MFVLSGPQNKEAFDDQSGIRVVDAGMRGPEIESHHWRADFGGHSFEFSTYVTEQEVLGRHRVQLSPRPALIDYLLNGSGQAGERKALVDKAVEGIAFLFPNYYRAPFFFEREPAVKYSAESGRPRFSTVDAPGLWSGAAT